MSPGALKELSMVELLYLTLCITLHSALLLEYKYAWSILISCNDDRLNTMIRKLSQLILVNELIMVRSHMLLYRYLLVTMTMEQYTADLF